MRESRTYGSGRGACHEMHVPTATHSPRLYHAARRSGGDVAPHGAGAAVGAAGDRLSPPPPPTFIIRLPLPSSSRLA